MRCPRSARSSASRLCRRRHAALPHFLFRLELDCLGTVQSEVRADQLIDQRKLIAGAEISDRAGGEPVPHRAPYLGALVRIASAVVRVGAISAGTEIDLDYRNTQLPQTIHDATADAASIHEHYGGFQAEERCRHSRCRRHSVRGVKNFRRPTPRVTAFPRIYDGGIVTEAANVNAEDQRPTLRNDVANGGLGRGGKGNEALRINAREDAANTDANEVGVKTICIDPTL